ncbi:unnamed protein product [Gordionus sp. m RMFG-2023]
MLTVGRNHSKLTLQDQECLKMLKSNYNVLNGFFLEKNVSRKDLPQDFKYLINPKHMCMQDVTNKSDPLAPIKVNVPKDIFIIIMIHSAPSNVNLRESIRETWGSVKEYQNYSIRLIFMLGIAANETIQAKLTNESKMYEDIVQASFIDAYVNMTYKISMGFKWISYYCPQAKFVLKMDDDIFADILQVITTLRYFDEIYSSYLIRDIDKIRPKERLLPYLYNRTRALPIESFGYIIKGFKLRENLIDRVTTSLTITNATQNSTTQGYTSCDERPYTMFDTDQYISTEYRKLFGSKGRIRDIILCRVQINERVLRDGGKWHTTPNEYPGIFYEPYCSGWIMILTPPTAYKIHKAYFARPYYKVDDAHVTGRLARMAGTLMIDVGDGFNLESKFDEFYTAKPFSFGRDQYLTHKMKYIFFSENDGNREKIKSYWTKALMAHNRYGHFLIKK